MGSHYFTYAIYTHFTAMTQVVHNNRFGGLELDLGDTENTTAIVEDALNAVRREKKLYVEDRRNNFGVRLLEARDDLIYGPRKTENTVPEIKLPVETPERRIRVDEFDFAKPGLGFVERFEGPHGSNSGRRVQQQLRNNEDNVLTL